MVMSISLSSDSVSMSSSLSKLSSLSSSSIFCWFNSNVGNPGETEAGAATVVASLLVPAPIISTSRDGGKANSSMFPLIALPKVGFRSTKLGISVGNATQASVNGVDMDIRGLETSTPASIQGLGISSSAAYDNEYACDVSGNR